MRTEKKRTVILVDNSLYITGSIHSTLQTIEQLKEFYHFIIILPSRSSIHQTVESRGFKVIKLPMLEVSRSFRVLMYFPRLLLNTIRLIRIIRRERAEILHINDIYNMLGVMTRILYPRVKVVYYVRLLRTSYIRPMYRFFAFWIRNFSDEIICVSSAVQKDIGNPGHSNVIYTASICEKSPGWTGIRDPAGLRILYLGNYIPGKGQALGLYALAKLRERYPNTRLDFFGGTSSGVYGPYKEKLKSLAAELGLGGNANFGEEKDDIEELMKSYDTVLNLSESESFSMICLEAISYGVPLVVSDCGGPAEITDGGRVAFLVPNRDWLAAAEALVRIIEDPSAASEQALTAKIYSRSKFDPRKAVGSLKKVYG